MINKQKEEQAKNFVIAGLPKSGKRLLVNMLGSHSDIAIPPTGLAFQNIFSEKNFAARGGFDANLDFLVNSWYKNKTLNLQKEDFKILGQSRKDLYLSLLEAYRTKYFPHKRYSGEYSHHTEEHFNTWIDWFGFNKLKFMYVIRNPFENYASYVTSRNISWRDRDKNSPNPTVHNFSTVWSNSAATGLYRSQKHPNTHQVFFFEDIIESPENFLSSLCDWLNMPLEMERMLNMVDFEVKQSSIVKTENKENSVKFEMNGAVRKDSFNRKKLLSDYEIEVLNNMECPTAINAFGYNDDAFKLNLKQVIYHEKNLNSNHTKLISERLFLTSRNYVNGLKVKDQIRVIFSVFWRLSRSMFSTIIFKLSNIFKNLDNS